MLLTAHQLPSLEAWNALEHAQVLPDIAQRANKALHGEVVTIADEWRDLEGYALPKLLEAERLTAWTSIVGQALFEYTSEQDSHYRRKLTSDTHPIAIGVSLLQERLMEYRDLGFASPHALARAVSACAEILYCVNRHDEYWLSTDGRFTFVSRNIHGDMHISQVALSTERSPVAASGLVQPDLFVPTDEHLNLIQRGAMALSPAATLNQ
jgi:hypothetical protein